MKKPQSSNVARAAKLFLVILFLSPVFNARAQFTFTTNGDGSLNIALYTGSHGVVLIPNTTNGLRITSIGAAAFFNNTNVTSVTIGTNVGIILDQAFSYSTITSVALPASVTNIAFDAFLDCYDLTNFTVATNDPDFSGVAGVLFNQNQTTLISYPEGRAGGYAVPNSVTNIGIYAFFGSSNLASVALSTNVDTIENYAVYNCPGLAAIAVNTNNQWYSSVAGVLFDKNQDTLIAFPAGNAAASYTMPNVVTNIGMEAFYGCQKLTNVTIGTNVVVVGDAAFDYCTALEGIIFPNSVAVISGDAFAECRALASIAIGTGVTNIMYQAFIGCSSIAAITVAAGNPAFSGVGGVLFDKNQALLVLYPPASSAVSYVVPGTVTNIMADAFMDSYNLASVTLDSNLQSLGDSAFQNCFNLTSIAIPNSVTSLGNFVFYQCVSLTNVIVGSGLNDIGFQVFAYCYSLAGAYFTTNAPAMNADAFDDDFLATAYYLPGMTGWSTVFDGLPTALWLPQIVDSAVRTNQFGFLVNWASGEKVVVEACTNLAGPVWSPLQTNLLSGNSWPFSDPQSTNFPNRFYRAISP